MRRCDRVPRQKSHFHQSPRILFRKIDALQNPVLSALQFGQIPGRVGRFAVEVLFDTRLHIEPNQKPESCDLKFLGRHGCAIHLHLDTQTSLFP